MMMNNSTTDNNSLLEGGSQGLLPSDWVETTLGEVVFSVSETFNFKNKQKIHFLNTGDIAEGKLLHKNLSDVSILPGQ